MTDSGDITLAMILEHMRGMENRLRAEFKSEIGLQLGSFRTAVEQRFDRVDQRLDRVERKVDLLSVQMSNIDARLDDIEVVQIPALRQAVGIR